MSTISVLDEGIKTDILRRLGEPKDACFLVHFVCAKTYQDIKTYCVGSLEEVYDGLGYFESKCLEYNAHLEFSLNHRSASKISIEMNRQICQNILEKRPLDNRGFLFEAIAAYTRPENYKFWTVTGEQSFLEDSFQPNSPSWRFPDRWICEPFKFKSWGPKRPFAVEKDGRLRILTLTPPTADEDEVVNRIL